MEEIKEITEQMIHKELVDTLNHNFKKLDEDAKATRKYIGEKFDEVSRKFKKVDTDIFNLQKDVSGLKTDMTDVKTALNMIIDFLKSDNDKSLLTDNKK